MLTFVEGEGALDRKPFNGSCSRHCESWTIRLLVYYCIVLCMSFSDIATLKDCSLWAVQEIQWALNYYFPSLFKNPCERAQ